MLRQERDYKTISILGANGTMGNRVAALFAAFGEARVYLVCRDMQKAEYARHEAVQSVRADAIEDQLIPKDYSSLEKCLRESDVIYESVAETYQAKEAVWHQIVHFVKSDPESYSDKLFCTGTSGMSITSLARLLPERLQHNFLGLHFFNPPYSMPLLELIPTPFTDAGLIDQVRTFCRKKLYRHVIIAKDSPAFLANRVGFFFLNTALQLAERFQSCGGIDYIDAVLGPFTGRAMPPLRTIDFVGLDIHEEIVANLYDHTHDYAHDSFSLSVYVHKLLKKGCFGLKSGIGFYKDPPVKDGTSIKQVYDIEKDEYRELKHYEFPFVQKMIEHLHEGDYDEAFDVLKHDQSKEARLCLKTLLQYVLYALHVVAEVGENTNDVDDAMAEGFNWCPPLALIDAFGGRTEFMRLCRAQLAETSLAAVDLEKLMAGVIPSKYDYRRYMRAKAAS